MSLKILFLLKILRSRNLHRISAASVAVVSTMIAKLYQLARKDNLPACQGTVLDLRDCPAYRILLLSTMTGDITG